MHLGSGPECGLSRSRRGLKPHEEDEVSRSDVPRQKVRTMTLIVQRKVTGEAVRAPISTDRRRRRLSGVVRCHADRTRPHMVSVHRLGETVLAPTTDTVVLCREQKNLLVGPQDVVVITYLPQGGGGGAGGGSSIVMAVAAIALMVVAPYIAGPLAGAMGGAMGLSTAAVGVLGKVLATGSPLGSLCFLSKSPAANASGKA